MAIYVLRLVETGNIAATVSYCWSALCFQTVTKMKGNIASTRGEIGRSA